MSGGTASDPRLAWLGGDEFAQEPYLRRPPDCVWYHGRYERGSRVDEAEPRLAQSPTSRGAATLFLPEERPRGLKLRSLSVTVGCEPDHLRVIRLGPGHVAGELGRSRR